MVSRQNLVATHLFDHVFVCQLYLLSVVLYSMAFRQEDKGRPYFGEKKCSLLLGAGV